MHGGSLALGEPFPGLSFPVPDVGEYRLNRSVTIRF